MTGKGISRLHYAPVLYTVIEGIIIHLKLNGNARFLSCANPSPSVKHHDFEMIRQYGVSSNHFPFRNHEQLLLLMLDFMFYIVFRV